MLPQKLGLDVLIERGTGRLVTVEINGQYSGYQGLQTLEPTEDKGMQLVETLGEHVRGGQVLISPLFQEFYDSEDRIQRLLSYGARVTWGPPIGHQTTPDAYQELLGQPLSSFDAILGIGSYVQGSGLDERMINTPSLELMTCNKILQYHLLRNVKGLNMPRTWLFDTVYSANKIRELLRRHGELVGKVLEGIQGNGVHVINMDNIDEYAEFYTSAEIDFRVFERHGYEGSIIDTKSLRSFVLSLLAQNPAKAVDLFNERYEKQFLVAIQRFVQTIPVICQETGEAHHARARLLWFGGYAGGYWALSSHPASSNHTDNTIVNYTRTGKAQAFTPEQERIFKAYAETVVPRVLATATEYNNRTITYKQIMHELAVQTFTGTRARR